MNANIPSALTPCQVMIGPQVARPINLSPFIRVHLRLNNLPSIASRQLLSRQQASRIRPHAPHLPLDRAGQPEIVPHRLQPHHRRPRIIGRRNHQTIPTPRTPYPNRYDRHRQNTKR